MRLYVAIQVGSAKAWHCRWCLACRDERHVLVRTPLVAFPHVSVSVSSMDPSPFTTWHYDIYHFAEVSQCGLCVGAPKASLLESATRPGSARLVIEKLNRNAFPGLTTYYIKRQ